MCSCQLPKWWSPLVSQTKAYGYLKEISWRISLGSFLQRLGQSIKYMMFQKMVVFKDDVNRKVMGKMGWERLPRPSLAPVQDQLQPCVQNQCSLVGPDRFLYRVGADLQWGRYHSSPRQPILELGLLSFFLMSNLNPSCCSLSVLDAVIQDGSRSQAFYELEVFSQNTSQVLSSLVSNSHSSFFTICCVLII